MLEAFGQAGTPGWQLVAGNWKLTRMPELRSETMTVNMGPQHPSTHGVLRIVLELSGETVVGADTTIGFLHTGIEKTAEQKKWQQVIPLVERMDYLARPVEQPGLLPVGRAAARRRGAAARPRHPRADRRAAADHEPSRVARHARPRDRRGSVMMYCFREREQLLNVNEMLAGFRMFPSYLRIGGLREDLPTGFHEPSRSSSTRFRASCRSTKIC